MTTFERRKTIVRLVREQPGVKVSELARLLDVSEGTIRNDLSALADQNQLTRVRGGAVILDSGDMVPLWVSPMRMAIHADAKQRIARWAAEMIENGDSLLLDSSSTVLHMAPFLRDRRNLMVVTNGLEVARSMAENPSNTVIVLGGILRSDGVLLSGAITEKNLKELHIQRVFLSCDGFSFENGLTEADIQNAQLKSQMIASADQVIALVDSSKFGKVSITSFASVDQITHIFTDSDVNPQTAEQIRQMGKALTTCERTSVMSYTPHAAQRSHYQIGFANLGEEIAFAVDVRRGLERAAKDAADIDLIVTDNQLNGAVALENADELIARGIDLMIEFQIDDRVGSLIMSKFQQAGIPVIAIDIPIVGATYVGADNYKAGLVAGSALGTWIENHWQGQINGVVVLEEPRAGSLPALRIQGQLDGLFGIIGRASKLPVHYLDSANTSEVSESAMLALLERVPEEQRLAVVCFNDDAALGALAAARRLEREQQLAIVGQGADRRVREEIRRPGSAIIGSTGFMPEQYGPKLLQTALKILRGEPVPPAAYVEHQFVDATNVDLLYPV